MVQKDELLKDLRNDLSFEEEIIVKITDFYKALGWRHAMKKEHHKDTEAGLDILKNESKKHAGLIKEMISYVEGNDKSEF